MPRYDFHSPRLYINFDLSSGTRISLDRSQANYLLNVLRMKDGGRVLLFNGRDGEWHATIVEEGRKKAHLVVGEQTREQTTACDLHYLFAPLKQARLDYMVQKAVEMGAGRLQPVLTQFTQNARVKRDRMQANAVEAAEQCGILALPEIGDPVRLERLIGAWNGNRRIVFCDEGEESQNPLDVLQKLDRGPVAVLVGPEGGFSEDERALLRAQTFVTAIPLGPRVLRADTAAVAAIALVQAALGDWR